MGENVKLNTRVPFTQIPNDFLQNPSISAEAKGTAAFLQSLPYGWQIHPDWIQQSMNYGTRIWRRVSKELMEYGCLKYHSGGVTGGAYYEFSFYNYYPPSYIENTPRELGTRRLLQNATVAKRDCRKMSPHINKLTINKQTNETTNKQDVVVINEQLIIELNKLSVNKIIGAKWIQVYGEEAVKEKIKMLQDEILKGTPIRNSAGWLKYALDVNFEPSTPIHKPDPKLIEKETQIFLQKQKDLEQKVKSSNRSIGQQALAKLKGIR